MENFYILIFAVFIFVYVIFISYFTHSFSVLKKLKLVPQFMSLQRAWVVLFFSYPAYQRDLCIFAVKSRYLYSSKHPVHDVNV